MTNFIVFVPFVLVTPCANLPISLVKACSQISFDSPLIRLSIVSFVEPAYICWAWSFGEDGRLFVILVKILARGCCGGGVDIKGDGSTPGSRWGLVDCVGMFLIGGGNADAPSEVGVWGGV